jgi:hypothetical protein
VPLYGDQAAIKERHAKGTGPEIRRPFMDLCKLFSTVKTW